MRKYQEHQTVVAVKAAYSILSNAYKMAVAENGDFGTWDIKPYDDMVGFEKAMAYFIPHLKIVHSDRLRTMKEYENKYMVNLIGIKNCIPGQGLPAIKLTNGMYLLYYSGISNSSPKGHIAMLVDINGVKPPNTYGKDIFQFSANEKGFQPASSSKYCNLTETNVNNGKMCTGWVIYKGNMDYLRRDVSSEWPTN